MIFDIRVYPDFEQLKNKFLTKVFIPGNDDDCWLWKRGKRNKTHKDFYWKNKHYGAHRISYMLFNGSISKDKIVRHTCDNPICVNPKHLVLGTYSDNSIDSVKRNKQGHQRLNEEAVKVIRWMLKYRNKRGLPQKLASLYGISINTVYQIKYNKSWRWITV